MQYSHYIFGPGFSHPIDSGKSKSYYLINTNLFLVSFVKIFIEFFLYLITYTLLCLQKLEG